MQFSISRAATPPLQLEREATATAAGELWPRVQTYSDDCKNEPGDACRNDRHNAFAGQLFLEPVQGFRFIEYNGGGMHVHSSLVSVVLHD